MRDKVVLAALKDITDVYLSAEEKLELKMRVLQCMKGDTVAMCTCQPTDTRSLSVQTTDSN